MRDVAQLAGVSIQTVSNVINGRAKEMSSGTQQRVLDAIEQLEFHPNSAGRALRAQRSRTLGFLILDPERHFLSDPMTDQIIAGIGDVVRDRHYSLLIHAGRPGHRPEDLLEAVVQQRVDGVFMLLSGSPEERHAYVHEAQRRGSQVVLFERSDAKALTSVIADNESAGAALVDHLAERGHERIAFIASEVSWPMIEQRHAGFVAALERHGIERDPALEVFQGAWTPEDGARSMAGLLELDRPPTAVMAGNDLLALGAIHALHERGLDVPADMAVTGFNDFDFAAYMRPRLTTVRVPGYRMGVSAATELVDALESAEPLTGRTHVLPVELLLRDSS